MNENKMELIAFLSDDLPKVMRTRTQRLKSKRLLYDVKRAGVRYASACQAASNKNLDANLLEFLRNKRLKYVIMTLIVADVLHQKFHRADAHFYTESIDKMLVDIMVLTGHGSSAETRREGSPADVRREFNPIIEGMLRAVFPEHDFSFYLAQYASAESLSTDA